MMPEVRTAALILPAGTVGLGFGIVLERAVEHRARYHGKRLLGGQGQTDPLVQGVGHDISVERHTVTLSLIDAPVPYFRIGDAVMGLIGGTYLIGF